MAQKGYGVVFSISTDGGSTYSAIGDITDLTPPTISKDTIETTSHGTSGIRTYVGGLVDFGEVSVTVNLDPDVADAGAKNHVDFRTLAKTANDNPTLQKFKIEYADGGSSIDTFSGIVTSYEASAPMDGVLSATFTIKVSGEVTYT
tara:strand:+ start:153 stop:590 length:438 start_codon:yes stop_codon:yes gene_type:complete